MTHRLTLQEVLEQHKNQNRRMTRISDRNFLLELARTLKLNYNRRKLIWLTDQNLAELNSAEDRSEEHTSELQSRFDLVCRLLLEKKNYTHYSYHYIKFRSNLQFLQKNIFIQFK